MPIIYAKIAIKGSAINDTYLLLVKQKAKDMHHLF